MSTDRHNISEAFRKNVFNRLEAVSKERQGNYGNAEESFTRIATMWEAYWKCKGLEVPHKPVDVAMLMTLFKMTREMYKHDFENILDGDNYFAFAGGFNAADKVEEMAKPRPKLDSDVVEDMFRGFDPFSTGFSEGVATQEREEDD